MRGFEDARGRASWPRKASRMNPSLFERVGGPDRCWLEVGRRGVVMSWCLHFSRLGWGMGRVEGWGEQTRMGGEERRWS